MKKVTLSHHELLKLDKDHRKAAKAARLSYAVDRKPGICRVKKGKGYLYTYSGKTVTDKADLERIRKLAIPPSWTDVWICPNANGHIQATGIDMNGRKQYRYHGEWSKLRTETKFHRLYEFGKALPSLRRRLKKDMAVKELTEEKVLATIINLAEKTYVRIGNNGYEKLYGSYGLTTLKDRHVTVKNEHIHFCFTGKKGIEHSITLKNKRLARVIKQCRDIPGRELFQYYTLDGRKKSIDSGMVNNYIKEATGAEFTAKDFRTWAGSLHALDMLRTLEDSVSGADIRKNVITVLDAVSNKLGNSRSICKKYYVHPVLLQLYEDNKLKDCISPCPPKNGVRGLSTEEKLLMQALKKTMQGK